MNTMVSARHLECAPWCAHRDTPENHYDTVAGAMWCFSPDERVSLSMSSESVEEFRDVFVHDYASAYLGLARGATFVQVVHGDVPCFDLTLAEARAFAAGVLRLVERAEAVR